MKGRARRGSEEVGVFRRSIAVAAVVIALAAAGVVGAVYLGATSWRSPAAAEVDIATGSTVREIAAQLSAAGVIRQPRLFEIVARIKRSAGQLHAGSYAFPAGTTLLSALGKLERGDVMQFPFTAIEGWTIKEIAAALRGQKHLASEAVPDEFIRLASDPQFVSSLGFAGAQSLEGYLFPDTYFVTRPLTAEALLKRMVARFREVFAALGGAAALPAGLAEPQLVTLASIVEKETGAPGERPLIASVFYNRLQAGIPLQSDPTIIYGLPRFDGNIRREDIADPHPYNTYVHPGLPPGPISNPGRASLEAVLRPAQTDYLYFVSRNDGTHAFSRTLEEHMAAVRQYQLQK